MTQLQETKDKLENAQRLKAEWGANDKLTGGERLDKAILRHTAMLEFLNSGIQCKDLGGEVLFGDKFHYILATGRWRVTGKSTWYRSKGPKHFYNKYVIT